MPDTCAAARRPRMPLEPGGERAEPRHRVEAARVPEELVGGIPQEEADHDGVGARAASWLLDGQDLARDDEEHPV